MRSAQAVEVQRTEILRRLGSGAGPGAGRADGGRALEGDKPAIPLQRAPTVARAFSPRGIQAAGSAIRAILQRSLDRLDLPAESRRRGQAGLKSSLADLLHHLDEFLELERIQCGIESFEQAPFRLDDVLFEAVRTGLWRSDVDVLVELAGDVPEVFLGDPIHLKEVIALLVERQVEKRASSPCIMTVECEAQDESRAAILTLRVRATGTRVGDPGSRGGEIPETEDLGASLLAELMTELGGSVEDPRAVDGWTLRIPLTSLHELGPVASVDVHAVVVVAEPCELQRGQLVRELERLGCEVLAASTASGLLEKLEVLSDRGVAIHRVLIAESFVTHPETGAALLAGVEAAVGACDRIVRIEAPRGEDRPAGGADDLPVPPIPPKLRRPILRSQLREALRFGAPALRLVGPEHPAAKREARSKWVDFEHAVERFEGDEELYRVLLAQFQLRYRDLPRRLESERRLRPAAQVAELAHRVAGVASSLGLLEVARALEAVRDALIDPTTNRAVEAGEELDRIHAASCAAIDGLLTDESLARARDLSRALSSLPRPAAALLN